MKSLGAFLRQKRQESGISLEQISADTRISMNMLLAIEEGKVEQLPAPVLVKGFLRAYADGIGLDPEAVIVKYQDVIEEIGDRREAMERFHQRLHPKSSRKPILALLLGLTLLAGTAFLLYTYLSVRSHPLVPPSGKQAEPTGKSQSIVKEDAGPTWSPTETGSKSRQTPLQSETGSETGKSELNAPAQSVPDSAERPANLGEGRMESSAESQLPVRPISPARTPYVLRAEAKETTWLRIIVDDGIEREYLLRPDEQLTWLAKSNCRLLIGNAAGLQLYLNDQPLKPLGERGEVVKLELPDPSLLLTSDSE